LLHPRRLRAQLAAPGIGIALFFSLYGSPGAAQATLAHADVNRDGLVDSADLNIVRANLGRRCGQTALDARADVNSDCVVNVTDVAIVSRNLGAKFPPTIAAVVEPAANPAGWHTVDVTVSFACTGTASCPADVSVATEGANQVVARTVSNAGGSATAQVVLNVDKTPPIQLFTINPATQVVPGGKVSLAVSATDNIGVADVALLVDGALVESRVAGPFLFSVPISPNTPTGTSRVLSVKARDAAGNSSVLARSVLVEGVVDTQPPVVTLSAPGTAQPGSTIPIVATAVDNVELVKLSLSRDGAEVREVVTAPFSFQQAFVIPADAGDGTTFTFAALATDVTGNVGTASTTVKVAATTPQEGLTLVVNPPVSPTFQTSQVITGAVGTDLGLPPAPRPLIASLSTTSGRQGETLDIGISGANTSFVAGATQLAFGSGLTVNSVTVLSEVSVTANVTIAQNASIGPRAVSVSTGTEEALLTNAFNVLPGVASVGGRVVNSAGQGIAGAEVCVAGTTICGRTGADGSFALENVPVTSARLLVNALGFDLLSLPLILEVGASVGLGDLTATETIGAPPPVPPGSPVLPDRLSRVVARLGSAALRPETMSREQAERLVLDAVLLVGADELGAIDPNGNQLNPQVSGTGPLSLTPLAVGIQGRALRQGQTTSLEEVFFGIVMAYEWSGPEPPAIDAFVADLQQRVEEAWASPDSPESALAILLFNNAPGLSPLPPRLARGTRVNTLQALLLHLGVILSGYHAQTSGPGNGPDLLNSPRAKVSSIIAAVTRPQNVDWSQLRSASPAHRASSMRALEAGQDLPVPRRQLSRLFRSFAPIFAAQVKERLVDALTQTLLQAAVTGSVSLSTIAEALVGPCIDLFRFNVIASLVRNVVPAPPVIEEVRQVGRHAVIRIRRTPRDSDCQKQLHFNPSVGAGQKLPEGFCTFNYSVYRASERGPDRVIVSNLQPRFDPSSPDHFTVEDPLPVIAGPGEAGSGGNWYYADVVQQLPVAVPEELVPVARFLSVRSRILVPVVDRWFYITSLISQFSRPNPSDDISIPADSPARLVGIATGCTDGIAGVAADPIGNLFYSDHCRNQYTKVTSGGQEVQFAAGARLYGQLAVDGNGSLFAINRQSEADLGGRLWRYAPPDGNRRFVGTVKRSTPGFRFTSVSVTAMAVGPSSPGAAGAFVPGDLFAADEYSQSIRRIPTSKIPPDGIEAMEGVFTSCAPGEPCPSNGEVFGPLVASPIFGQPFVHLPSCGGGAPLARDMAFDRQNNLYVLQPTQLIRFPYSDAAQGARSAETVWAFGGAGSVGTGGKGMVTLRRRDSRKLEPTRIAHRSRLVLTAHSVPCNGTFNWTSSDGSVATIEEVETGTGMSSVRVTGRKPGVSTISVTFTPVGGEPSDPVGFDLTVLETGPILFVHGWNGLGSKWQPPMDALADKGMPFGGLLCASWVRDRNATRWLDVLNASSGELRPGNQDPYRCEPPSEDGSYFTLNFEDTQRRFVDVAGELADIIDQVQRVIGGPHCGRGPGQTEPLDDTCPRLTLVAHSMGGQTARAYLQEIPHSRTTADGVSPMPQREHLGQVRKLVTIGTMFLGTPVTLLTGQERLFVGALSLGIDKHFDPVSSAVNSMRPDSGDFLVLNAPESVEKLAGIELVSLVTDAGLWPHVVCSIPTSAQEALVFLVEALKAKSLFTPFASILLTSLLGTIDELKQQLCPVTAGLSVSAGIPGLPEAYSKLIGAPGQPSFAFNSDEVVGIDSQNVNNLFRFIANPKQELVQACQNENPEPPHGVFPEKVVCLPGVLHHFDQLQADALLRELDLRAPTRASGSSQWQLEVRSSPGAQTVVQDPSGFAVDFSGTVYVSDRGAGTVSTLGPSGRVTTLISGLDAPGRLAVLDGYLGVARSTDVIRVPLGLSGTICDSDGLPLDRARINVGGFGGTQTRDYYTDGFGNFNVPLEAIRTSAAGSGAVVSLWVTTGGTATRPGRTEKLDVELAVSPSTGWRQQTVVSLVLPPG